MEKYEIVKTLGKGSRSQVYHVRSVDTHEDFTLKIINKGSINIKDIKHLKDYYIPSLLNCTENIICVIHVFEDDDNYYVLSKYFPDAGDLIDFPVTALSFVTRLEFALIIARAIKELHSHNIIHRDIKLENILFVETVTSKGVRYSPIVIDFDLSCIENSELFPCIGNAGTPAYAAPELFESRKTDLKKSDIYSLGIVFFYLFSEGGYPYEYIGPDIKRHKYQTLVVEPEMLNTSSERLNQFVDKMLDKDYNKRPTIETVVDNLSDILQEMQRL